MLSEENHTRRVLQCWLGPEGVQGPVVRYIHLAVFCCAGTGRGWAWRANVRKGGKTGGPRDEYGLELRGVADLGC